MADGEHSLFSASGADGWSVCTGKPALEEGRKTSSEFADWGTACHTLSAWVMTDRIEGGSKTAADWLGTKIKVTREGSKVRTFTVDSEMAECADEYVDRFMLYSNAKGSERFCEQRVHYHEYLGVEKRLAFGTGDGIAILWDQPELEWNGQVFPAGDELQIHDLKGGKGVLVEADGYQTKLYGVGALWEYGHLGNFTRVRMVIHQPRKEWVDEIVMTPAELVAAVSVLRRAVPRVLDAYEKARHYRALGKSDLEVGEELHRRGDLVTSDKGCRFCDAAAVCPAMIADAMEHPTGKAGVTAADFEDLTVDTPEQVHEYGSNYIAAAYLMLDRIERWSKAVRAEIDRRVLLKGETFDACKVVAGQKGARKWIDQGEAEAFARRQGKPIRDLMFKSVLLTAPQMEKALGKAAPMTWAQMQGLYRQEEGKPAVVPRSDSRPAISHKALVHDFEDLTAEEQPAARMGAAAGRARHPFRD